jgi:hypothetical protein
MLPYGNYGKVIEGEPSENATVNDVIAPDASVTPVIDAIAAAPVGPCGPASP